MTLPDHIARSLYVAFRFLFGDTASLKFLDASARGVLRSFTALLPALPLYFLITWLQLRQGGFEVFGKAKIGSAGAKPGIEIVNLAPRFGRKRQAGTAKTQPLKGRLHNIECAGVSWGNAGTAHQVGGKPDRVDQGCFGFCQGAAFQGRNSSLIEVLARVPASTFLTITAA